MKTFGELPHKERMKYRDIATDKGCDIVGYYGEAMQVRLPNPPAMARDALLDAGMVILDEHHFPIGTDRAPDHLRHSVLKYGDGRGFFLNCMVTVR